jgi:hypothetical protein
MATQREQGNLDRSTASDSRATAGVAEAVREHSGRSARTSSSARGARASAARNDNNRA